MIKILCAMLAASAVFFYVEKAISQTNNEVYEIACNRVGDALPVLEAYFVGRWESRKAELKPDAARNYLAHFGIEDDTIRVFVFQSHHFPSWAVVAARPTGSNNIDCIVRIQGRAHKEFMPDALQVILKTENGAI